VAEQRNIGRRLRDFVEGLGAALIFGFFRMLPMRWASELGGFLARNVGPRLGVSKRADLNLRLAMPELDTKARRRIIRGMWDNLGRVGAEYPHIHNVDVFASKGRVEVLGFEKILAERQPGRRYIFFSAHYGNWELGLQCSTQAGFDTVSVYRAPNNPWIERLIDRGRRMPKLEMIPKGAAASRRLLAALNRGSQLCILVDQKMNDGIPVPFFGRPAMTAPALARLALRFNCIVVPVRVERLPKTRFRLIADPPIAYARTGNAERDTLALMTEVNAALERWIRAKPDQWFWLHRRWSD